MLQKLESGVRKINAVNNALLVVVITAMFFLLMLTVASRFLFYFTMIWADDVMVFLLLSAVFLGSGTVTAEDKHIRLDFFVSCFSEETIRKIMIIAECISILFLVAICYQTVALGVRSTHIAVGVSPFPLSFYYGVIGFGCLVMLLNFVVMLIKRIKRIPVIGGHTAHSGENQAEEEKRGENRP